MIDALALAFALTTSALSTTQEREETKIGAWTLLSTTDAMTDQSRGIAMVAGEGGSLVIKCDSGGGSRKMYVSLLSDRYLGALRNDDRQVMIRFGTSTPIAQTWWHDRSSASQLDQRKAAEFINQLVSAERVAFRLTAFDHSSVNVLITDLSGAREAVGRAYELCGNTPAFPPAEVEAPTGAD